MRSPELPERLRNGSIFPTYAPPEAFPAYLAAESGKWGELIRARGTTLE